MGLQCMTGKIRPYQSPVTGDFGLSGQDMFAAFPLHFATLRNVHLVWREVVAG
jgi:hypothetical protein